MIFERVYEPYLPKVGEKAKLKRRHNILKVKRFENGPKELKVVLTESSKCKSVLCHCYYVCLFYVWNYDICLSILSVYCWQVTKFYDCLTKFNVKYDL